MKYDFYIKFKCTNFVLTLTFRLFTFGYIMPIFYHVLHILPNINILFNTLTF